MENNTWYRVDNVAKVFLASYSRRDTRAFRVSCTLHEKIDPEILQTALDQTVMQRPQFQVEIHKGLFWHYMERTDKQVMVKEEHRRPCPYLYGPGRGGKLHYSVSYWNNRINLDMFHALSDGNGGMEFLNILVQNYLQLKHPNSLDNISVHSGASADDLEQDSYKQFYGKKGQTVDKLRSKAYHIHGLKHGYDQLQFFEIHMSAAEVLKLAKAANASLTSYMGAKLMMSIYKDMPALQRNKPITISMPVNLRNFYPSSTSRNFFNSVYVTHVFTGSETLEELAHEFDKELKEAITPERIAARMDNYEKMEHSPYIRMVPLFIKNPVVNFATSIEAKKVSAVISNLGRLQISEEIKPYIKGYSAFCSTNSIFMTTCSYDDDLTLGVCSAYRSTSVLRNFIKSFTDEGIEATVYATETY